MASAVCYGTLPDPLIQRYSPFLFGLLLGLALLAWGRSEQLNGKIRGARVYIHREAQPGLFNVALIGKRYLPGAIMLAAGIWYGLMGPGS